MESAKCAAEELGKIIKYSKNCREKEENLAIFTVILMASFETKNVHSAVEKNIWRPTQICTFLDILKNPKECFEEKNHIRNTSLPDKYVPVHLYDKSSCDPCSLF